MSNQEKSIQQFEEKKRKREKRLILLIFIVLLLTTLFEIYYSSTGFTNRLLPSNIIFFSLLNINIILALLLIFMIFRNIVKSIFLKEKGSKFTLSTKLVISFFFFTSIPLILQLFFSSIIIKTSISTWFNTKIESSLTSTLNISKDYYKTKEKLAKLVAEKIFYKKNFKDFDIDGYIYGEFVKNNYKILKKYLPRKPIKENEEKLLNNVVYSRNNSGSGVIRLTKRDLVYGYKKDKRKFLIVVYYIGLRIHKNLDKISKNYSEYSYLKIMKAPIEKIYLVSLLLVTLLIIFLATWFAIYIARDITKPVYKLAEATKEISRGNLDASIEKKSEDEIGVLIDSFNKMVKDLKETRLNLIERQRFIENIINNINNGVISLDKNGIITTINPFAKKILKLETLALGKNYNEINNPFFNNVVKNLITENKQINKNFNIKIDNEFLTLSVFFTPLHNEKNEIIGYLFVFNDLTQIIISQKTAAWREVARRIAHEIKNPLTPIQLSAQRLKRKYLNQINENREEFEKIINTIVQHVLNIKNMVNEFSNFAKMPEAKLKKENLNEILEEIYLMYKNSYKNIEFKFNKDEKIKFVNIDKNLFSQAIINIIKNAIHSFDKIKRENKIISIETKFLKDLNLVQIIISDNGSGVPDEIKERIFEPYFSTKNKGTGIGLTIVKKIISDHNGYIRILDNKPEGTKVIIELPVDV